MAGDGGGGSGAPEPLREAPREHEHDHRRRGAAYARGEEAQGEAEDRGEGGAAQRLRFSLTIRRVRIDPERKRVQYLRRLEKLIRDLDGIIADPTGVEPIRLRAMDMIVRTVRMCYLIVRDVDVERLEHELEELKEENQRRRAARDEQRSDFSPEPTRPPGPC